MTIQMLSYRFRLWIPHHRFVAGIFLVSVLGVIVANAAVAMTSRVNDHEQRQDSCQDLLRGKSQQLLGIRNAEMWNPVLEQDPSFAIRAFARR